MEVKNRKWHIVSNVLGYITAFLTGWLFMDAWILGDAGPDKIWIAEAVVTMAIGGLCLFAEKKAGVTYREEQESDDEEPVPTILRWMHKDI